MEDTLLWVLGSVKVKVEKAKAGIIKTKTAAEILMNRGLTNSLFAKTNDTSAEPSINSGPNMKNKLISLMNMFEMFAVS